ncbi:MAG: hypothetical protein AAFX80_21205 [Cyanobacteria bacterium J06639_18]
MNIEYMNSIQIRNALGRCSKDTLIDAITKDSEVAAAFIKSLITQQGQDKSVLIDILMSNYLSLSEEKIEDIIKELEARREELKTKIARALRDKEYYDKAVFIYQVNINSENPVDKIALKLESENTSFEMMDKRVKDALTK